MPENYEDVVDFNLDRLFIYLNGLKDYTYKVYFGPDNKTILCIELYHRSEYGSVFETEVIDDLGRHVCVFGMESINGQKAGMLFKCWSWKYRKALTKND